LCPEALRVSNRHPPNEEPRSAITFYRAKWQKVGSKSLFRVKDGQKYTKINDFCDFPCFSANEEVLGRLFQSFGEEEEKGERGEAEGGAKNGGAGKKVADAEGFPVSAAWRGISEFPPQRFDAFIEGGADGKEVVAGRGECIVTIREAIDCAGFGEPEEKEGGAIGADTGNLEGWVVGILNQDAELGDALLGKVDAQGVGGEAGDIDAGKLSLSDGAPDSLSVGEGWDLDGGGTLEVMVGGFHNHAGEGGVIRLKDDFSGFGLGVLCDN